MRSLKLLSSILFMIFLLTGCHQSPAALNLVFCAGSLDTEQASDCAKQIISGLSTSAFSSSCILMGAGNTQDAKLQDSIGQSQFAAMITAQEIDVILCTLDKDDLFAKTDSFMPLEKIFSAEELTELADRLIAYGTDSTSYGVILTDTEAFTAVFGDVSIGIFLADNCPNPTLAKEFMRKLVLE